MSVTEADIAQVLEALTMHPWVRRSGVRFLPSAESRYHEVGPDTPTSDWRDRRPAERALEGGLAYHDVDGQIVGIMLMAEDGVVTEIELWRGDDLPILSLPQPAKLWEVLPGQSYFPRGPNSE